MPTPPELTNDEAAAWFDSRLPDDWFTNLRAVVDRDEILITGTLDKPTDTSLEQLVDDFREQTREQRVAIAQKAEATFERKVSWGVSCADTTVLFTHLAVPVMTRLRSRERHTLDTLVAAGVARSRSDALGWCVRLVADHEGDWLDELREAIEKVETVRAKGPQ